MTVIALTNAKVTVGGTDLSDHLLDITLTFAAKDLDKTAMSATGWEGHLAGLKSGKLDMTFLQDYAASSVDVTLWGVLGTTVTVVANPVNAANSPTNPAYSFSAVILDYPALSGKVGDVLQAKVSAVLDGAPTRLTA